MINKEHEAMRATGADINEKLDKIAPFAMIYVSHSRMLMHF